MKIESNNQATLDVALAFFAAINAHDTERVLALFHQDIDYRFYHGGFDPVIGHAAVTAAWAGMIQTFPDVHEEILEIRVIDDVAIVQFILSGTLAGPLPLGGGYAIPNGTEGKTAVPGVDLLKIKDGQVIRKDTYIDAGPWFAAYGPIIVAKAA